MKAFKLFLFIFTINFFTNSFSQPYVFFTKNSPTDPNLYDVYRYNFNDNNIVEFLPNAGNIVYIASDNEWLYYQNRYELEVRKISDTSYHKILLDNIQNVYKVIYVEKKNEFAILFQNIEGQTDINLVNEINCNVVDSIPNLFLDNNNLYLSHNEDNIYYTIYDTLTTHSFLVSYSLNGKVGEFIEIDTLGFNTGNKIICDVENDLVLINYNYPDFSDNNNYYQVYDLNNNKSNISVNYPYRSKGYLSPDGDFFVIQQALWDTTKSTAEDITGKISIYQTSTSNLISSLNLLPNGFIFKFDNYPEDIYYYIDSTKEAYTINVDSLINEQTNSNLTIKLTNSTGSLLTGGYLQYYDSGWKDAVNNGDGTFTVITTRPTVSIRVYYEYASKQADNVPAQNNTYTFQTVNATVQLKNSSGNLMPAPMGDVGTVQYYAGAWRSFGTTVNGVATKELLPINYSFRMSYEYGSQDKQQNLSVDPTVVFQTVNAAVQLKNSLGNLMPAPMGDVGIVQYYAGAWRSFGTTSNGVATKELLPINYSFRMTYEYGSIDKQQNLSFDPTVIFQTVNAAVQLKNSSGNLMPAPMGDVGTVQYYAGAWRSFGTTSNGVAYKELLPINYSFRMTYEFVSKDKQQNLSTNPVLDFNTVLCSVKVSNPLANGNNQPINNAEVKYYSGAWRNFGVTNIDGIATKELLPASLSFRASYGNVSLDKQQDISVNNLVEILLNIAP